MSKPIGNAGERNHRDILRVVWPDIEKHEDRYHPTDDHKNTGYYHVQSKKRKTWNIKDVVRNMEDRLGVDGEQWLIVYEDRDRRKKENPSGVYGFMPIEHIVWLLHCEQCWLSHECDERKGEANKGATGAEPPEQLDPTDLAVELIAQLVDVGAVEPDFLKEKLATRLSH